MSKEFYWKFVSSGIVFKLILRGVFHKWIFRFKSGVKTIIDLTSQTQENETIYKVKFSPKFFVLLIILYSAKQKKKIFHAFPKKTKKTINKKLTFPVLSCTLHYAHRRRRVGAVWVFGNTRESSRHKSKKSFHIAKFSMFCADPQVCR